MTIINNVTVFLLSSIKKKEREMERASVYMIMSAATEGNCHTC